jgi:hypothetical protein
VLHIVLILPTSTSLLRSIGLPFLSSHRRACAQSYAVPPAAPISPQVLRTPARKVLAVLNTPPPKPSYAQQLKLKGSLTDPPHTRRRPPFGHVRIYFSYTFHTLSLSIDSQRHNSPTLTKMNISLTHRLCIPRRVPQVSHSPSMIPSKTLSFPLSPKPSRTTSHPTSNTNPTCIFIVCHFKIPRKSISRRVQCVAVLLELLRFLSRACILSAQRASRARSISLGRRIWNARFAKLPWRISI